MKHIFKEFLILDYFTAKKGNQKQMNTMSDGHTPLVSAKKIDNGYKDFVNVECKDLFMGHCITLNNDGDGGAGMAFYQPADFALDTHVTALYPKQNLSKYQMIYIANCISKQRILFGHGRSINSSRLAHFICMLPVTPDGSPDFKFMEQYMRHIEKKLLKRYARYLEKKGFNLLDNDSSNDGTTVSIEKWGELLFEDLFYIKPGVRLTKDDMTEGNRPFIGATDSNNGITAFCGNTNKSLDSNCLGVNYNGSVVENFYHPYEALFSDDVKHLHLRGHKGNKYIYLFLKNMILKQKDKFQYGYKFNGERMLKQTLLTPIEDDGSPDYKYMEQYMREKEQKIIHRYIYYRLKNV